jgi:hypothetical protein
MHKLLLASIIALSLSAPAAMAQGVNINVGSGGISTNLPSTLGTSVGGVLNTLLGQPNNSGNNNQMVNGLPATNMDSFVYQAGGSADLIYGDEGVDDIPPYFEFDKSHRIAAGITGQRSAGLTTGHGSYLPDAWGGDEWVKGPEFDMSGPAGASSGGPGPGLNINLGGGTNINLNGGGASLTGPGGINVNAGPNGVSGSINGLGTSISGSSGF